MVQNPDCRGVILKGSWQRFWFAPASPHNLVAARVILSLNALWLVASRPTLPEIAGWPAPFWSQVRAVDRIRFLMPPLSAAVETTLYVALVIGLIAVAAGKATRLAALMSALLLYHFAPFEDIFATSSGPYFRGFTFLIIGLFIIAFAETPRAGNTLSGEYRWPVALMRLLFAFTYLLSGISKLRLVGLHWGSGANFEGLVLGMIRPDYTPPWASAFIGHPFRCWAGGLAGFAMDFLFIAAVFSPVASRFIIPAALISHLVIARVFGVMFLGAPSLLLFVNWEWVAARISATAARRREIVGETSR